MKHVNLLIKPASGACNLRCQYCFYKDVSDKREQPGVGVMSQSTAHSVIDRAFAQAENGDVQFVFQGGEPTLAGLDFFEDFTRTAAEHRPRRAAVRYAIQTNGVALNEEWALFFKKHGFLVGLSVDGRKDIHDALRQNAAQKGSFGAAAKALALLQKHAVEVNLLCVVSRQVARHPQGVYAALKKLGVGYLQFIPCLDPLDEARGGREYSLTPEAYAHFLCGLFDVWYADWERGRYVSVRLFDDYVHLLMGEPPGTCATAGQCGGYCVVEADGGVYPCDFYVLDEWRLGDIRQDSLANIENGALWRQFRQESMEKPAACAGCEWFPVCRGGCKRDWARDATGTSNYYCGAFKAFFAHATGRLRTIARAELAALSRRN